MCKWQRNRGKGHNQPSTRNYFNNKKGIEISNTNQRLWTEVGKKNNKKKTEEDSSHVLDRWWWAWCKITSSQIQMWTWHVMTADVERVTEMELLNEMEIGLRPMLRWSACHWGCSLIGLWTHSSVCLFCFILFHYDPSFLSLQYPSSTICLYHTTSVHILSVLAKKQLQLLTVHQPGLNHTSLPLGSHDIIVLKGSWVLFLYRRSVSLMFSHDISLFRQQ